MEYKGKHFSQKKKKKKSFPLFAVISFIIMCACGVYIYNWLQESNHNKDIMDTIRDIAVVKNDGQDTDGEEDNNSDETINFEELKKYNSDVVGWIKVNNTNIDYPVVQCSDNSFYLSHSLDKTYNGQGWPFVDYEVRLDGTDKNITIYGHNIKNGSMFGSLKNILNKDWYENSANWTVEYITPAGIQDYRVFSVYQTEKELYYTQNNFKSDAEYADFIQELKSRSVADFDTDVETSDSILTLSTCANNNQYRVVLHAKKM